MTQLKETQIIQCPTTKSFDLHLSVMDRIIEIGALHKCKLEWKILNKKERTILFNVCACSRNNQQNALIDVMKFLGTEGIEPGVIISIKTEKSEAETRLNQVQKILDEFEIPV